MKSGVAKFTGLSAALLFTVCLLSGSAGAASSQASRQGAPTQAQSPPATQPSPQTSSPAHAPQQQEPSYGLLTPQQAKELFRSVHDILNFASNDTKLPIEHEVKRRLISREQVEKYVLDKFHSDKDAKRMEHEEIVLKKFGLLDRDFHLRPFLVSLLTEQIAGFYDNKTKTVNLLNWVPPADQKPVIAHELTHALQDQHVDLEKWEPDTPDKMSKNVEQDNQRLSVDEQDTARDAVLEGQAMSVYVDYSAQSSGVSLQNSLGIDADSDDFSDIDASSSPVMARAPKLLQESLLFPYRDGLRFERTLLRDKGPQYAFAGVLDRPPSSSYEIIHPRAYEQHRTPPLLRMPDLHPLLSTEYEPYDIGVMGELDVRILISLFADDNEAAALAPQWDGGIYFAVQRKSAKTAAQKGSTASLALLYLSDWRTTSAAEAFARIYSEEIGAKYAGVSRDRDDESGPEERIYRTSEGPVLIVRQGRQVFVSESFDLNQARKLEFLLLGAQQGSGVEARLGNRIPVFDPAARLGDWIASYGMMKAAMPR